MSKKPAEKPAEVKLKSVFGIPPGLYLLIFYIFIAVSVIFLVFFLPGIIHNGSIVIFSTTPNGAAIYSDDIYIGSGEFSEFIPKGIHTFTFKKYGYETENIERTIGGRILFSWLFPKRESVTSTIKLKSLDNYLLNRAKSLYEWSYITDYSSNYFYPEIYTELAEDLSETELSTSQVLRVSEFYKHTAALISSKKMLLDYDTGAEILQSTFGIQFTESDHMVLLKNYFSGDVNQKITPSYADKNALKINTKNNSENIQLLNIEYFWVAEQTVLSGNPDFMANDKLTEFPYWVSLDSYAISTREISVNDYALFVEQNPNWSVRNKQNLIDEGLVDDQYLLDVDLLNPDDLPIRNISWNAAKAFCSWVTASLPSKYSNLYMSLPSTGQWQYAASMFQNTFLSVLSSAPVFSKTPINFLGNVWELCNDTYLPTGSSLYENIDNELDDGWTQKTVMGGSWANNPSDIALFTIGSIEPYSCSEFIGFRPVLLFKE